MEEEYKFLVEKYTKEKTKMDLINGLFVAQAICSRKLIESHNQGILDVMESIASVIENIKDDNA